MLRDVTVSSIVAKLVTVEEVAEEFVPDPFADVTVCVLLVSDAYCPYDCAGHELTTKHTARTSNSNALLLLIVSHLSCFSSD